MTTPESAAPEPNLANYLAGQTVLAIGGLYWVAQYNQL